MCSCHGNVSPLLHYLSSLSCCQCSVSYQWHKYWRKLIWSYNHATMTSSWIYHTQWQHLLCIKHQGEKLYTLPVIKPTAWDNMSLTDMDFTLIVHILKCTNVFFAIKRSKSTSWKTVFHNIPHCWYICNSLVWPAPVIRFLFSSLRVSTDRERDRRQLSKAQGSLRLSRTVRFYGK